VRQKEPLLIEQLPAILMAMRDDELAMRDRALMLLGYAGALRRSELVALDVEHLRFTGAGCYVWIASAKNDPRKKGRELLFPGFQERRQSTSSVPWRRSSGGLRSLIRRGQHFVRLIARAAYSHTARLGRWRVLSATDCRHRVSGDFAGHSLRRGFITNAARRRSDRYLPSFYTAGSSLRRC